MPHRGAVAKRNSRVGVQDIFLAFTPCSSHCSRTCDLGLGSFGVGGSPQQTHARPKSAGRLSTV